VEKLTIELLNEVESGDGLIIGITEDIPAARWSGKWQAIVAGLQKHAQQNPDLYP